MRRGRDERGANSQLGTPLPRKFRAQAVVATNSGRRLSNGRTEGTEGTEVGEGTAGGGAEPTFTGGARWRVRDAWE